METSLTVFDLEGRFRGLLDWRHLNHEHKLCLKTKETALDVCWAFERDTLAMEYKRRCKPFWKVCHAGLAEWVVPIYFVERATALLCMGPFQLNGLDSKAGLVAEAHGKGVGHEAESLSEDRKREIESVAVVVASYLEKQLEIMERGELFSREEQIKACISRFRANPDFCLKDLAKQFHLSEARMTQILRKSFGKTFPHMVEEGRISQACQLLRETRLSVKMIADEVGYTDANYFMRRFKAKIGMTPTAYRRLELMNSV
jgi:AraC-like DNA-binding protein